MAPGAVIPTKEILTAVSTGAIEMTYMYYGGYCTGILPEADIEVGLPFAWLRPEEAMEAFEEYGLREELEKVYAEHNVFWQPAFFDSMYVLHTTFPLNEPEDMAGKVMRAPGIYGDLVKAFGGSPVSVPFSEVYMALKLGTMDGSLMSPSGLQTLKLEEVFKYLVLEPNLSTIVGNVLVNMDALNALPEDVRAMVMESAKLVPAYWTEYQSYFRNIRLAEQNYGLKVIKWDADATKRATEAGLATWDTVAAKSPRCARLVEIVRQQMRDYGRLQ